MNKKDLKLTKETTALVKDLELQLDYLIGYAPSGNHWKNEYYIRKALMDNTLVEAPQEIVDKINKIEDSLYRLRNNIKHEQGYITYSELNSVVTHKILVHDWQTGKSEYI